MIDFSERESIVSKIESFLNSTTKTSQIITLNPLIYIQAKKDKDVYCAIKNAALVIPDAIGIVLIGGLLSFKFYKRFPGIELIYELCKLSDKKKYRVYLLGGKKEVVEKTAKVLRYVYGVNIVGYHDGYFDSIKEGKIIEEINTKKIDILFVALSTEKQEKWIYKNLNNIKSKIVIGVGGSFDVISGCVSRAPTLFRRLGLEWFFRLTQEPHRIVRILKLPLAMTIICIDVIKDRLKL